MKSFPPFDPAVSDGCSGGVRQYRRHLCERHDREYWEGRTWLDKWAADFRLGWGYASEAWAEYRSGGDVSLAGVAEDSLIGLGRTIGVLVGGNGAFWAKLHKSRLSKWRFW